MEFAEFVKGVRFRFLQPERPRPSGFRGLATLLRKVGLHLEVMNTVLPEQDDELKARFKRICKIPRMSTFAIGAMINRAVSSLPEGQVYLNIGVWNGFTYFSGVVGNEGKRCIGVDDFSHKNSPSEAFLERFEKFKGPNDEFIESDFREYFKREEHEPIGVYLFDGPHSYEDQWDGLELAEPFFADNCIILVDDCNWEQVSGANLDFMRKSKNEYKLILDCRTPKSGHPTWWNGFMVFQLQGRNVNSKLKRQTNAA
ncbi:MAG: hypothetical protein CMJ46_06530 [Planctomyces sp.]|nr:hypothetical protein [Planctomyces sp.]